MRTFKEAALAALLACLPAVVYAAGTAGPNSGQLSEPSGDSSPGAGSSLGVSAGWQFKSRERRSAQAGGAATVGAIVVAAAAATLRRH